MCLKNKIINFQEKKRLTKTNLNWLVTVLCLQSEQSPGARSLQLRTGAQPFVPRVPWQISEAVVRGTEDVIGLYFCPLVESLFLTYNHCALRARRLSRNRFCPLPCLFSANTNIRKVMGAQSPCDLVTGVWFPRVLPPLPQVMGIIASAVLRRPASKPASLHPTTRPFRCSPHSTTCIELVFSI